MLNVVIIESEPKNQRNLNVNGEVCSKQSFKLEDNVIENISECFKQKLTRVNTYYSDLLLKDQQCDVYQKYIKEMSICIMFFMLEIKQYIEIIKPKQKNNDNEEIHFIKIYLDGSSQGTTISNSTNNMNNIKYDYCYINFILDDIVINKQNQILDSFKEDFLSIEADLKSMLDMLFKELDINIDDIQNLNLVNMTNDKYFYNGNIEGYFFKLFENASIYFSKKEYQNALPEFEIAQFVCEYIIFINMITSFKKENSNYKEIIDIFKKMDNTNVDINSITLFTFIGGVIKTFKNQNIIIDEDNSNCEKDFFNKNEDTIKIYETIIGFYPDILKLIKECEEKIKEEQKL